MSDDRKKIVSVRMTNSDLDKFKEIARRMRIKESELFRFAVKQTLSTLMPLHDSEVCGKNLLPIFMECGDEINNHFSTDAETLDSVINGNVTDETQRVEREDIELIAMMGVQEKYGSLKLTALTQVEVDPAHYLGSLKQYLYDKYFNHRHAVEGAMYDMGVQRVAGRYY